MDSCSSSITSSGEASKALKSLLKVGKPDMSQSSSDTPTVSLQDDIQKLLGMRSSEDPTTSQVSNLSNGEVLYDFPNGEIDKQQILLLGDDQKNSFSVYGKLVDVIASKPNSAKSSGSNKVQIHPIVNFDWEHKLYTGNLVAVHRNCLHVAYVLRVNSSTGGIVRVINRKSAERTLLKGFQGRVVDIAFAHLTAVVIGAVDEVGNMFVHEVTEDTDGKIDVSLLLHVKRPQGIQQPTDYHRLLWCPFIPDEEEASSATMTTNDSSPDDASKLLVLTHGTVAEMWNVDIVTKEYGEGPLISDEVEEGHIIIDSHTKPIFDASFSPDGTALATAGLDGEVKFFQVGLQDRCPPKCLYQWKPHGGRPVTSLFFLDDHKTPNPDVQFWKFAITGCDNNRELRVWSCESWTCLQTLVFEPDPDPSLVVEPCLKVSMDLSASFLVVTDIKRKVLYVMQIYQDREAVVARINSVSEFLLTQPCLSLAILDAGRKRFKITDYGQLLDDITTDMHDEDEDHVKDSHQDVTGILLKLCTVHTKALQELRIKFQPESSVPQPAPASLSSVSHDEGVRDLMSDISLDTQSDVSGHSRSFEGQPGGKPPPQPMLMTPGSFTNNYSPRKDTQRYNEALDRTPAMDSARSSATIQSNMSSVSTLTQVSGMDEEALRSARGSLLNSQTVTSPQSSVTLTPASSKDMSVSSQQETPSSVPLPPPTPGEDTALASPPLRSAPVPKPSSQLPLKPAMTDSPTHHPAASLDPFNPRSVGGSDDFLTSSPASRLSRSEFKPPRSSQSDNDDNPSDQSAGRLVNHGKTAGGGEEDLFRQGADLLRTKLGSAESSSSTSLEVREIMEGSGGKKPYLGDNMEEEEDTEKEEDESPDADTKPVEIQNGKSEDGTASRTSDEIEEVIEAEEEDTDRQSSVYGSGKWPKPPEPPELHDEARRIATEALHRAATYTIETHSESTGMYQDLGQLDDVEDDDDVRVEEEQEEMVDEDQVEQETNTEGAAVAGRRASLEAESPGRERLKDSSSERVPAPESSSEPHSSREPKTHSEDKEKASNVDGGLTSGEPAYHSPRTHMARIEQLQCSVQQMVSLMQTQQREMEKLRQDLSEQRNTFDKLEGLQSQIDSLEGLLTSKVSETLTQHSATESQRLHQALGQRESHDKQKHDALLRQVTQTLHSTISHKLERVVKDEITNNVLPKIEQVIEPIKQQLHLEVSQKLTATDLLVKDNIAKLIRSRQTVEAMGTSAGNALQGPIQASCRDVLIPAYEKATQNLFQQMNSTFQRGIHDYTRQLEGHLEQVRHRQEEVRDPVVQQLQSMVEAFRAREHANESLHKQVHGLSASLQSNIEQNQNMQSHIENAMKRVVTSVHESIVTDIKKLIHDEVVVAMRDQQSSISTQLIDAMRSGMMTPVPATSSTPDIEQQKADILLLLRQGQLNAAFQQALSVSNLDLVLFVCETVNPSQVFNQSPCPLQQPVLLSLVQQLSADLTSHLDLKLQYLTEAVVNLDKGHSITKEHTPRVLGQLCDNLNLQIKANPHDRFTRNLRMLLMAAQSLMK